MVSWCLLKYFSGGWYGEKHTLGEAARDCLLLGRVACPLLLDRHLHIAQTIEGIVCACQAMVTRLGLDYRIIIFFALSTLQKIYRISKCDSEDAWTHDF